MGEGGGLEGRRHEGEVQTKPLWAFGLEWGGGGGGRSCCLPSSAVRAVTAIITVMAFKATYTHYTFT